MNYEIHGNSIPHLHLHLYPRFSGDPFEGRPIAMDTPAFTRTEEDLRRMADAIVAVRRGASQTGLTRVRAWQVPCLPMVRLDRIYTRAGDAGETSLGDGERVSKSSARIWAYGTVDETGAAIGVAIATGLEPASADLLRRVQNDLFDLGADLAVPVDTERGHGKSRLRITEQHVAALEAACDEQGERLAPLTSFVLSGGTPQSAALHLARTVCRGAERHVVALSVEAAVNPHALSYLNRLSDLLFILARVHNDEGRGDVLWQPGSSLA